MFIPIGTYMQFIEQVDKDADGKVTSKKIMGVAVGFVLLSIQRC
jgi:protein-L-isoaspartate(D-aspartate) O-methyltransferase